MSRSLKKLCPAGCEELADLEEAIARLDAEDELMPTHLHRSRPPLARPAPAVADLPA